MVGARGGDKVSLDTFSPRCGAVEFSHVAPKETSYPYFSTVPA